MARGASAQEVEAPPEADRLDDAPHPRETAQLFGHAEAEATLAHALASGRMQHAWLVTGPEGVGKATLAYRFARAALSSRGERDPGGETLAVALDGEAARLVRARAHPRLLVLTRPWNPQTKRHRTEITIDEVRRLKSFLSLTVERDAMRIVLVDTADELNASAANALLKSLEEPPLRTVFLVLAAEPGRLLPTIRSRCRRLDLKPLTEADLRRAALKALEVSDRDPPGASDWARLVPLSEGSVRRLLTLWADGGLKLAERLDASRGALPRLDWGAVHALSDELGSAAATDRFEAFYGLLLQLISRMVRAGAGVPGSGGPEAALADRLAAPERLAVWAELWETIVRDKGLALALNLDRKSLIVETFRRIELAAAGA